MIILGNIKCALGGSVQVELPRSNMILDPRPNNYSRIRFECAYHDNGTTVTLTRTDDKGYLCVPFEIRVYDAAEDIPDFDSTTHTYMGVDGERIPSDTALLIIGPSVKVIKSDVFSNCRKIRKCVMHDGVEIIQRGAFYGCLAMRMIRLSRTLKRIDTTAFFDCKSLDAIFLPDTIEKISERAFMHCVNIRFVFIIPCGGDLASKPDINIVKNGNEMIFDHLARGYQVFYRKPPRQLKFVCRVIYC